MDTPELTMMVAGGNRGGSPRHHDNDRREFTVKEYAHRERVDERTVRRWLSKGAVDYRKTPGGGVRIIERP